jgi:hypothetical protein
MDAPTPPLCHCGRPLRHPGHHLGHKQGPVARKPAADVVGVKKSKLRTMVENEIKTCHASIVRLKGEIRARQDAMLDVDARLQPLVKLLEVYRELALPAPDRKPPPVLLSIAPPPSGAQSRVAELLAERPRPVAREAGTDDKVEADYEPLVVDFNQVAAWAATRSLRFKSWDDLPKINERREQCELPTFARKMPRIGVA